jgi:hypothetical protein
MELATLIKRHEIILGDKELEFLQLYYSSKIKISSLTNEQKALIKRLELAIFKTTENQKRIYKVIINLGVILTAKLVNTEISETKKQIIDSDLSYEEKHRLIEEKRKVIQDKLETARKQYDKYKDYNSYFQLTLLRAGDKRNIATRFTRLKEEINRGEITLKTLDTFSKCLEAQKKMNSGIDPSSLSDDEHDAYYLVMFSRAPEKLIVKGGRRRDTD